jgi:pimeloyl-ACP methyl ester carboxylesterase
MVDDIRAALGALSSIASVDTNRLWLVGFDRGTLLALHVAVLDSRVCGVAVMDGLTPMRPSLANRGEPTFAKAQHSFPLLPRFGAFAGHEDRLPYDNRELVGAIAPRPVLVFAGMDEKGLDANDLGRVYTPMKHVSYRVIEHSRSLPPDAQQVLIEELKRAAAR